MMRQPGSTSAPTSLMTGCHGRIYFRSSLQGKLFCSLLSFLPGIFRTFQVVACVVQSFMAALDLLSVWHLLVLPCILLCLCLACGGVYLAAFVLSFWQTSLASPHQGYLGSDA